MEPLSATASILTVLGAAGGSVKFVHDFILDFIDAPTDIRNQAAQLESLRCTIMYLIEVYNDMPQGFQLDSHIYRSISEFTKKIHSIQLCIEKQTAAMSKGRGHRVREKLRWMLFDHPIRKFFESLGRWNVVFTNAASASQMALLIKIERQHSFILPMLQQPPHRDVVLPNTPQVWRGDTHNESSSLLRNAEIGTKGRAGTLSSHVLHHSSSTQTFALYLSSIIDPIGVRRRYWYRLSLGSLSLEAQIGTPIIRQWSTQGSERYVDLPLSEGCSALLTFQEERIIGRRVTLLFGSFYRVRQMPWLSFRFNLHPTEVLSREHMCFAAIRKGDSSYLRQALSSGKLGISSTTTRGDTLLHIAAFFNQFDIMTMLLGMGVQINTINNKGENCLHISVKSGRNEECARLLISKGVDLCHQDNDGRTPLHTYYHAVTKNIITWNLEDTDPWAQDVMGMTIFHYVSWSKMSTPHDIALLLRVVPSPAFTPSTFKTQDFTSSPLRIKDVLGRSVLHFATQRGNIELMSYFLALPEANDLSIPDNSGRTLLHYATESRRTSAIDYLVERNFDLRTVDDNGRTLMHHAAANDSLEAVQHLQKLGLEDQMSLLDREKNTPFQLAVKLEAYSVVAYLLPLSHNKVQAHQQALVQEATNPGVQRKLHFCKTVPWMHSMASFASYFVPSTILLLFMYYLLL